MENAQATLAGEGYNAQIDLTTTFVAPAAQLAGYTSWGSNDYHFSQTAYNALRFVAGGIAETAVSTSASNIRTAGGGQSQIPDPSQVFPSYVAGRTLAEAFYSGLDPIAWKEVVIGDPICRPYASTSPSAVRRRSAARHALPHVKLSP